MDVEKLIRAAEYCKKSNANCYGCPTSLPCVGDREEEIFAVRDYVRSQVISQVREWAKSTRWTTDEAGYRMLITKLDELAGEERHG